jgi:Na+/H+-translocating membrane pyrophosphatase
VTVTGAHVAFIFLAVVLLCLGMALCGSWRDVRKQIRESRIAPQVEPDYERIHYAALNDFLLKEKTR